MRNKTKVSKIIHGRIWDFSQTFCHVINNCFCTKKDKIKLFSKLKLLQVSEKRKLNLQLNIELLQN